MMTIKTRLYGLFCLSLLFFMLQPAIAHAAYYPQPYYSADNLWTLENESWTYYKSLTGSIQHERILTPYTFTVSGNPALQSDGFENNYGTVLINTSALDSDYPVNWTWFEAESANISKSGSWQYVSNSSYFNSTLVRSNVTGDYLEFNMTGSAVSIIWQRCVACGYIDVYLNDSLFQQIDTYGGVSQQSTGIYFSQSDGFNNVKLRIGNDVNPSSSGQNITIDAVKFGSSRYQPFLLDKMKFVDGKFYNTSRGSASSNYTIPYFYTTSSTAGWFGIYNLTFYAYVNNPTSKTITFGIADNAGTSDYANGTAQTTSGKIYCTYSVPATSGWALLKFNSTNGYCAAATNSTHAGMRRTFWITTTYASTLTQSYRLYTNDTGLQIDSFWMGADREMPAITITNARTGEDLSNGGYMSCDDMRYKANGINFTISNLAPSSGSWSISLYSPNTLDYQFNVTTFAANNSGVIKYNNFYDSSARLCADYDYSNYFVLYAAQAADGTGGSVTRFSSPPILVLPWNWALPEYKMINLNSGNEEYVLRNNTPYKITFNITNTTGDAIASGITSAFSFSHMYGTEGMNGGYENTILRDGVTSVILSSDTQISLNYNSTSKLWERNFTAPASWKYDGHISYMRFRVTNSTNSTYRLRQYSYNVPIPAMSVMFSNHNYSGTGMDVAAKDIDFGTSWSHPLYTTSGGSGTSFNDGVNDVYIEDGKKIILIYKSVPGTSVQTPITWFDKKNGFYRATYSTTEWAPGYTYLSTYNANRRDILVTAGLGLDYAAPVLQESNDLGYSYNTTLFIPADSDWMEVYYDQPNINALGSIFQGFRVRSWGNQRILGSTASSIETLFGTEKSSHFYRPFTLSGMTQYGGMSLSNVTAKPPSYYIGYTTTTPMPSLQGMVPCYPYCREYDYTDFLYGYNISQVNDKDFADNWKLGYGVMLTDGLDEYKTDSQSWGTFNYNYADLKNFNLRKMRARYIIGSGGFATDGGNILLAENRTWRYGYPTSYSGEGVDIWLDRNSRAYGVGESATAFFKARNYTSAVSGLSLNISVYNSTGLAVYSTQKTTDSGGMANISVSPATLGTYKISVASSGYRGVGFFWTNYDGENPKYALTNYTPLSPNDTQNVTCYSYWTDNLELASATITVNASSFSNQTARQINSAAGWVNYTIDAGILEAGSVTCNITVQDTSGQSNSSQISFIISDTTAPYFVSVSSSPNTNSSLDPNVRINITANLTEYTNISAVMLQYKNSSSEWRNITMANIWNSSSNYSYSANFTPTSEDTYQYRIFANDTAGNSNYSQTTNLHVYYDWTWQHSPSDFGAVSGQLSANVSIGNITINNTGEYQIRFKITSTWENKNQIFFNDSAESDTGFYFELNPGNSTIIPMKATAKSSETSDILTITADALNSSALPDKNTTAATVVSFASGPFLLVTIPEYNISVTQGDSASLKAKIQNKGNETATNAWLAFSLPSGWTVTSGSLNGTIGTLAVNDIAYNNITASISDSASTGTQTITASAGSSENKTGSGSVSVAVNAKQSSQAVQQAASSGGGGGSAGASEPLPTLTKEQKQKLFQTEETYELVRGREQNFILEVENPFDGILENVSVSLSGFLSQYLKVSPSRADKIAANNSFNFTIWIEAPKYFTKGKYDLNFTISGLVNKARKSGNNTILSTTYMKESRLVNLVIYEVAREDAAKYMNESMKLLQEMSGTGLNTKDIGAIISQIQGSFGSRNYEDVKALYDALKGKKESAFSALSLLDEMRRRMDEAAHNEIKVQTTARLVLLAKSALDRGDYDTALKRAEDAKMTYALETSGKINIFAFARNNWPSLAAATVIISVFLYLGSLGLKLKFINSRLSSLKKEEGILLGLIKEVQGECFKEGKLSIGEYSESLLQYEKKMSAIIEETIRLEAARANLMRFYKKEDKKLGEERDKLLNLIKKTQSLYMKSGKIETRVYDNRMKSYSERMAEIDERLAELEARKAMKGKRFELRW